MVIRGDGMVTSISPPPTINMMLLNGRHHEFAHLLLNHETCKVREN